MRRCIAFGLIAGALTVALSGCGFFDSEEREPWRAKEEARCLASGAVVPSAYIKPVPEIKGPRVCGLTYPFKVSALAGGTVPISTPVPLSCSMIPALDNWVREKIQPAAYMHFGMPVIELKVMGSYNCRTMNHRKGASLSEHSFANALDVSGFTLLDGRTIILKRDWNRGTEAEKTFLRDVHGGACDYFKTVLGPGSDSSHADHFHLDLRMHDPRGTRHVCKPRPNVTPSPFHNDTPMAKGRVQFPYPAQTVVAQAPVASPQPMRTPVAAHGPSSYTPLPPPPAPQAYPQTAYPQAQLAAAPAAPQPVHAPTTRSSDPIGMWLNQTDPYAAAPATPPSQVFPTGGPTGIY
jgi:hypothetical protein